MAPRNPQPDIDRLSTMAALVLLSYTLVGIIALPVLDIQWTVLGLAIPIRIETRVIMVGIAAMLAVVGSDWLMESHPRAEERLAAPIGWIMPGLAAVGIGLLVTGLEQGPSLWIGLVLAAFILTAVFIAEFVVIDPQDPRRELAGILLEGLAYLLVLQAAFFFRVTGVRALFAVPVIFAFTAAMAWRLLLLRSPGSPIHPYALAVGWLTAQTTWVVHYLPLEPLRGSLLLVLLFALAQSFASDIVRRRFGPRRALEYGLAAVLGLASIVVLA